MEIFYISSVWTSTFRAITQAYLVLENFVSGRTIIGKLHEINELGVAGISLYLLCLISCERNNMLGHLCSITLFLFLLCLSDSAMQCLFLSTFFVNFFKVLESHQVKKLLVLVNSN